LTARISLKLKLLSRGAFALSFVVKYFCLSLHRLETGDLIIECINKPLEVFRKTVIISNAILILLTMHDEVISAPEVTELRKFALSFGLML
jgi:hypothetical protein